MEGKAKSDQKKKNRMEGIPAESYLYSKVIPRHLRVSSACPPKGASSAGVTPTCAARPTNPPPTCPSAIVQPLTPLSPVQAKRTCSPPVTRTRRQSPTPCSVSRQVNSPYPSVTAQLKQVPEGTDSFKLSAEGGELERRDDRAGSSLKEPEGCAVQRRKTDAQKSSSKSGKPVACGRSTYRQGYESASKSKNSSRTKHETTVDEEGVLIGDENDDGYCALRRNTTPSAEDAQDTFFGRRKWTSEKRRHKEEWCPLSLQEKRHQYSEGNIGPSGGIWRERGHTPGSPGVTQEGQHSQPSLPVSVRDTRPKQTGFTNLSASAPADHVFQAEGRTALTMEEGCQVVFPYWAKGPRQTGNFPGYVNGQTGTGLGSTERNRRQDSKKDKAPDEVKISESLDDHLSEAQRKGLESSSEKVGKTQTVGMPPSSKTNPVVTPDLSSKGTEKRSTSEGTSSKESAQEQDDQDSTSVSFHSQHTLSNSLSASQQSTLDKRSSLHDTSKTGNSVLDNEFQAVRILQSCSACLTLCMDVRLMHCFHLLCDQCIGAGEQDIVLCVLCGTQQVLPQNGVPLFRDLFPGLFELLTVPSDPLSPIPTATFNDSSSQAHSGEQQLEPKGSSVPSVAALSKIETIKADNICVKRDTKDERKPLSESTAGASTASASTASSTAASTNTSTATSITGSVTGTSHSDCPDGLFQRESPVNKSKQPPSETPTTANTKEQQELNTDSSDNDDDNSEGSYSTTSLSDSSDNSATFREHDTQDPENRCKPSREDAVVKRHSRKVYTVTPVSPSRTCGACHVQTDPQYACVTCGGIGLCAGCHVAHRTLPVTRSHEVVRWSLSRTPLSPMTLLSHHQPLCTAHGRDLTLQCRTCAQLLCHRCLTPQHLGHEIQELGHLQHAGHKQFVTLKRGIKQHVLAARSSQRTVTKQLDKVTATRQKVRQAIHDCARHHLHRLTSLTHGMTQEVETCTQTVLRRLTTSDLDLKHVQREGERLRCLLEAITEDTPRLTQLILHTNCQAWFDQLRQQRSLQVGETDSVTFCPDLIMEDHLAAPPTLGRVCTLATSISDTTLRIQAVFKTTGEVSALAITPYKEVICVSYPTATCQVWDRHGALLNDVSHHVTDPSEVKVTPSGIQVILGSDENQTGGKACVTFLSPSGSLLATVPLSSSLQHTHMDCPTHSRLLISDGEKRTITLYGLDLQRDPTTLTVLRQVCHPDLINPQHVTITVTGDWLVNDQGCFMRVVSPEDHVTTVLTEDEPEAVLQPPRSTRLRCCQRMLNGVVCDTKGRMMSVDSGKNGLYLVTSGSVGCGERHFVSLQELTPSCHVTAMAMDRDDELVLGMSDGTVYIVTVGLEDEMFDDTFL